MVPLRASSRRRSGSRKPTGNWTRCTPTAGLPNSPAWSDPGGRVAVLVRAVDIPAWDSLPLRPELRAKLAARPSAGVTAGGCADPSLYRRFWATGFAQVHASFSVGDMDALGELFAEDIVWHAPGRHAFGSGGLTRQRSRPFRSCRTGRCRRTRLRGCTPPRCWVLRTADRPRAKAASIQPQGSPRGRCARNRFGS
jgi:hypothetical protein